MLGDLEERVRRRDGFVPLCARLLVLVVVIPCGVLVVAIAGAGFEFSTGCNGVRFDTSGSNFAGAEFISELDAPNPSDLRRSQQRIEGED